MDISLQLYSIKEEVQTDFAKALEMVEKAGYQGVEFAGYFNHSPDQLKTFLDRYNLKAVSTHVGLERLRTGLDQELEDAEKLGYKLIVCPYCSCETKSQILEDARFLETCAEKAAGYGVTIGYHNHAQEFARFDGVYALNILLETAPSVKLQPDVYWIAVAGVDPAEYLAPWLKAQRICAIHAKELAREGKKNEYIGQGKIDFLSLAKLCPPAAYPWIVEQEEFSSDHADGIAQSCRGLREVFGRL
ncbi:MAG: sugar phosphate isomerase/epimerase [Spirochaetaceae bacterium]|jgi:sugar phosphate isomerase/epimerase|nr:sugar phosphate isomerase/epimerase [Spirochaetaceae bacterium]